MDADTLTMFWREGDVKANERLEAKLPSVSVVRNNCPPGDSQVIGKEGKRWAHQVRRLRTIVSVMSAFHSSLFRMFTAHDAVEAKQVGGAKVEETQEGERFGHGVQRQAQRCRICSSRVYPHASHKDASA